MKQIYDMDARVEKIVENTRLNDKQYGGWMAVNIGTAECRVLGVPLQPTEGLNFLDAVQPGGHWLKPIDIEVDAGGAIRLIRLLPTPQR